MAVSYGAVLPRWWLAFLLFLLFFCSSRAEVVTIDVHAAKGLIQTGNVYLDVRMVEEFEKGHMDAAKIINIPYMLNTPKGMVKNPNFLKEVSPAYKKEDHLMLGSNHRRIDHCLSNFVPTIQMCCWKLHARWSLFAIKLISILGNTTSLLWSYTIKERRRNNLELSYGHFNR